VWLDEHAAPRAGPHSGQHSPPTLSHTKGGERTREVAQRGHGAAQVPHPDAAVPRPAGQRLPAPAPAPAPAAAAVGCQRRDQVVVLSQRGVRDQLSFPIALVDQVEDLMYDSFMDR
jgi:hypothetical protein